MTNRNVQLGFLALGVKDLQSIRGQIEQTFVKELKSFSIFVLPLDTSDTITMSENEHLGGQLSSLLGARLQRIPLANAVANSPNNLLMMCLFIGNLAPEIAKKRIEAVLLSTEKPNSWSKGRVRINQVGIFLPRVGVVACRSYVHGQGHYYRYRLATFKLDSVHNRLREFLIALQSSCPNQYFEYGPRASHFQIGLRLKVDHSTQHPLLHLAEESGKVRKLKSAHEDLEKYLLEADACTIACEVPVWLEPNECARFFPLHSNLEGTLTGHIDILRYQPEGEIEIWDYKPGANAEEKAHVQVYLYALMLSTRTNIPLDQFTCGYFDSSVAFFFNASQVSHMP